HDHAGNAAVFVAQRFQFAGGRKGKRKRGSLREIRFERQRGNFDLTFARFLGGLVNAAVERGARNGLKRGLTVGQFQQRLRQRTGFAPQQLQEAERDSKRRRRGFGVAQQTFGLNDARFGAVVRGAAGFGIDAPEREAFALVFFRGRPVGIEHV